MAECSWQLATNNCQHFVRDLVTILDMNIARKLSAKMDHKVVSAVIPVAALANGINEEARINEIYEQLSETVKAHKMQKTQMNRKRMIWTTSRQIGW